MILSVFPGIDLLGRAFTEQGYNVVHGPDLLWGMGIENFNAEPDVFEGVICTPPCTEFSLLNRNPDRAEGLRLLDEGRRVIEETQPDWWLMENVPTVPDMKIEGYSWQRFDINQGWYEGVTRLRHIQFGYRLDLCPAGRYLDIPRGEVLPGCDGCAVANDDRSFKELVRLQGLPADFDLPSFNVKGKKRAVGNGVPLVLGRVLAKEVKRVTGQAIHIGDVANEKNVTGPGAKCDRAAVEKCDVPGKEKTVTGPGEKRCVMCGRIVTGRAKTCSAACRKRLSRRGGE